MLQGGFGTWRKLQPLLLVLCVVAEARSLVFNPEDQPLERGGSRELLGVYNLEACAWVQDSVCQLEPQYGRLLYPRSDSVIQQFIFHQSECFTTRLKGDCESFKHCKWVKTKKGHQCIYQAHRWKEDAKSCSVPLLTSFISLETECKLHSASDCPTDIGCDIIQLPHIGNVCRIAGTKAIDELLNSAISQTELLKVFTLGARRLMVLDIPSIREYQNAQQALQIQSTDVGVEGGGGRKLQQNFVPLDGLGGSDRLRPAENNFLLRGGSTPTSSVSASGAQATGTVSIGPQGPDAGFQLSVSESENLFSEPNGAPPGGSRGSGISSRPESTVEVSSTQSSGSQRRPPPGSVPPPTPPESQKPPGDTKKVDRAQARKKTGDSTEFLAPRSKVSGGGRGGRAKQRNPTVGRAGVNVTRTAPEDETGKKKGNRAVPVQMTAPSVAGGDTTVGSREFDLMDVLELIGTGREEDDGQSQNETLGDNEKPKLPKVVNGDEPSGPKKKKGDSNILEITSGRASTPFTSRSADPNSTFARPEGDLGSRDSDSGIVIPPIRLLSDKTRTTRGDRILPLIEVVITKLSEVAYARAFNESGVTSESLDSLMEEAIKNLDAFGEKLENGLHANDKRIKDPEKIWRKLVLGAQDIAPLNYTRMTVSEAVQSGGLRTMEALLQVNSTWPEDEFAPFLSRFRTAERKLKESISKYRTEDITEDDYSLRLQNSKDLGDMISIFVQEVNRSFHEIYPVELDPKFVIAYNAQWMLAVARRNEKWHNIRRTISSISNMGKRIQYIVRSTHEIVSRPTISGASSSSTSEPHGSGSLEPYNKLGFLIDDIVGSLVAIYDGNYTISQLPPHVAKNYEILQKEPPLSRKRVWDIVQNVTSQEVQNNIIDELAGIVEAAVLITEAKIYQGARARPFLTPSPQEEHIVQLLDRSRRLSYEWSLSRELKKDSDFGTPGVEKAILDLSSCMGLGGVNPKTCSSWLRPSCISSQFTEWTMGDKTSRTTGDTFCLPKNVVPNSLLAGVELKPPTQKAMLKKLFEASMSCIARGYFLEGGCAKDDLCEATDSGCQLSSAYANFEFMSMNTVALSGANETCSRYLGLPDCKEYSDSSLCESNRACVWAHPSPLPSVNGSLVTTDGLSAMPNGTVTEKKATPRRKSTTGANGEVGNCQNDWLNRLLLVSPGEGDKNKETRDLLLSKHEECLHQASLVKCSKIDTEGLSTGPSRVPRGSGTISDLGLVVIPVTGVALIACLCVIIYYGLLRKRHTVAGKKGGKQRKKKGGGKEKSGKEKSGKSGKGKDKGTTIARSEVYPARPLPNFTTVIPPTMISSPHEVNDFRFVLENLSVSPDSQASSKVKATPQSDSEIHPVGDESEPDMDSDCSSSSCEGWSD